MKKPIKVGTRVTVEGRFIPEQRLEDFQSNNDNSPGYPQIGLSGKISVIEKDYVIVDFDLVNVDMRIRREELTQLKTN